MNLATINIAAILPAVVLSIFGIAIMVAEPFVSGSEEDRARLAGTGGYDRRDARRCFRWPTIAASGIRTSGSSTTTTSSFTFRFSAHCRHDDSRLPSISCARER